MRKSLLKCLLDYYDHVQERFNFESGESFSISAHDVELIMGLKDIGLLVHPNENIRAIDIPDEYKQNYNASGLLIDDMVNLTLSSRVPTDLVVRGFVLLLLGTVIAPVSRERIPISYYGLVQDVATIEHINWNALTLGFLKDSLALLKAGDHYTQWPSGNLALLQVCLLNSLNS
jgi:hypothetical protein